MSTSDPALPAALAALVGLPLWGPARDGNELTVQFGPRRDDAGGDAGAAGAYTLAVYCAWRLVRGARVLAGSADLFTPADPDEDLETFDYEAPGATWWDASWRAYVEGLAEPPAVVSAAPDPVGGCRIALSDGAALEVFPNSAPAEAFETEFWRLTRDGALVAAVGTGGVERGGDA